MRTWLTAAAVVLVMSVAVAPAQAEFLAQLKQGTTYTYTFTRGNNNVDQTGVVFLKINKSDRISSASPLLLGGAETNPDSIEDTPGSNIDALVIMASPSRDGLNEPGTFTLTVTNTVTQAVVVNTKQFTGDHQLYFQCVP